MFEEDRDNDLSHFIANCVKLILQAIAISAILVIGICYLFSTL